MLTCAHVWCVCMFMSVLVCIHSVWVHIHLFLRTCPPDSLTASWPFPVSLGWLSNEPQDLPASASSALGSQVHCLWARIFLCELESNSAPHACMVSTSPTQPSPQPAAMLCFIVAIKEGSVTTQSQGRRTLQGDLNLA